MATAELAARPQPNRPKRKPLAQLLKNLTSRKSKGTDAADKPNGKKNAIPGSKGKRHFGQNGAFKNNPYPQSGQHLRRQQSLDSSVNGNLTMSVTSRRREGGESFESSRHDRDAPAVSNRSGAPTMATNADTVYSDAGQSKAPTTTTRGGALSSLDGANGDSTFSSPRNSQHSLSTTLTTIQSTGTTLQNASASHNNPHNHGLNASPGNLFSHQYPVSPAPSTAGGHFSAIPRHLTDAHSTGANNLLTDNASILTLASSSKRRRRSMDTDASVRALAPSSAYGGSRESLLLSVLSGNPDRGADAVSISGVHFSQSRPSIGGIASAERASVYSNQGGTLPSERNSYYSYRPAKDFGDAKSLRSTTGLDSRSLAGDARSVNADAKSLGGDVSSLKAIKSDDGSVRSGAAGHSRNDSIPGSIGAPSLMGQSLNQSKFGPLSRRSSDWADNDGDGERKQSLDAEEERTVEEKSDRP